MLNKILRMRIKFLGHEHIATGEVMFTVGLVHLYLEQHDKAQKNIEGAKNIYSNSLVGASQGDSILGCLVFLVYLHYNMR